MTQREKLIQRVTGARIPHHMAVILDGNRRWARANGKTSIEGHRKGFEVAKSLSRFCREIGIHTVTLWGFSTENWRRDPDDVKALMSLFEEWIHELLPEAIEEEARVIHIGRKEGIPESVRQAASAAGFPDGLPLSLREALEEIELKTSSFERNVVNIALNYGGSDEIRRAFGALIDYAKSSGVPPDSLEVSDFLDTAGQPHPNPDLVWRTSGEFRLSGFLPLQSAYSEMIFTPKYLPDLGETDVVEAILEYSSRTRRFGG